MSAETELMRVLPLRYSPELTKKIREYSNIPSKAKIYFHRRHKIYSLYWRNRRVDEIGKCKGGRLDSVGVQRLQRHFQKLGSFEYRNALNEMEYREFKAKEKEQEEKDEKMKYYGNEIWKYGVRGSQNPKLPSIVVDGNKGKDNENTTSTT